ncbi:MAG: hypothetical protein HZA61_13755 [Candidatus Eisenbacteria bacterium]|uniref:Uncharacterized protein n=1 Tax=Eiseniibacteriota bacterium TaxID=2212470 RepID=A0A933W417_UNCEI|nr:hypothetical protein [Candidatus Eisenbacteria bacterium]
MGSSLRAWVVSADMGFGHQRAAHALTHLTDEGVVTAGEHDTNDPEEARFWQRLRWSYEALSRTRSLPLVGHALFGALDSLLKIPPFYPLRDLSHPSPNNFIVDHLVRQGLGRSLLEKLRANPRPLISTFYAPVHVADHAHLDDIYCVICDADLNRVWVASKTEDSHIRYFAPCGRVMRRLRQYGVPDDRIFLTGFTLPRENIGGPDMPVLKSDLLARIGRLDPRGRFSSVYGSTVRDLLGDAPQPQPGARVTVTFAVGGAGAQAEIGAQIAQGLAPGIRAGKFRLVLVAGTHRVVEQAFKQCVLALGLASHLGDGVVIVREDSKQAYFDRFNALMRETDVLWTKPSELSFYTALGIPIVASPPLGSQEDKNLRWLMDKGCALPQYTPTHAAEWLTDRLKDGSLAERALAGFIKNRKLGVYKIEEVLETGTLGRETHPLRR